MPHIIRPLAAIAALGALALPAQAALVQYASRLAFEAAAPTLTKQDFNSFVTDVSLAATSFDVGDFSIVTTLNNPILRIESNGADPVNVDGTAFVRGVGLTGDTFTYTFDTAITAFGVDLFSMNNDVERTRVLVDAVELLLPVAAGNVKSFFGVVSDVPFSLVTFRMIGPEDGSFDNISYGAAAVPTPATLALVLAGLAVLGLGRTRRR